MALCSSLLAPTKFEQLSLKITNGLPIRAVKHFSVAKKASVVRLWTILKCTALTTKEINIETLFFFFYHTIKSFCFKWSSVINTYFRKYPWRRFPKRWQARHHFLSRIGTYLKTFDAIFNNFSNNIMFSNNLQNLSLIKDAVPSGLIRKLTR